MGGPAILPLSLAKMAEMTQAFPDREFRGIGGIGTFAHALNYFMLGCGTVQVATAAMLDHAIGPNVIRDLTTGLADFLDRNADRGWTRWTTSGAATATGSSPTPRSAGREPRTTAAATRRTTPRGTRGSVEA